MVGQAQAGENGFDSLIYIPPAKTFDPTLQACQFIKRVVLLNTSTLNETVVLAEDRAQLAEAPCHYLENRLFRVGRHFLFQVSNAEGISAPDLAFICAGGSHDDAEKGGFSGAVSTDDANAFAKLDLQLDVGEERQGPISQRNVF
jgi:hypothetical protein